MSVSAHGAEETRDPRAPGRTACALLNFRASALAFSSLFFSFEVYFCFMCMSVACLCIGVPHVCSAHKDQNGVESSGSGVTNDC